MKMEIIEAIAADTIANSNNRFGYTVETLVANWSDRINWLGFKVGGKAWMRELFNQAKQGWIATTQKTSVFIPPSEETLSWGGFLGGEWISTNQMRADAEMVFNNKFKIS